LRADYRDRAVPVAAREALYLSYDQPAIFRLPTIINPTLDRRQATRGYTSEGESLVLYGDMAGVAAAADPAVQYWRSRAPNGRGDGPFCRSTARGQAEPTAGSSRRSRFPPAALAYGALSQGVAVLRIGAEAGKKREKCVESDARLTPSYNGSTGSLHRNAACKCVSSLRRRHGYRRGCKNYRQIDRLYL
jgi:hypothetical protein